MHLPKCLFFFAEVATNPKTFTKKGKGKRHKENMKANVTQMINPDNSTSN